MESVRHEKYMKESLAAYQQDESGAAHNPYDDALEIAQRISEKLDLVNAPPHYQQSDIECIDAIEAATGDGFESHLQGTVLKYLWRYRYKNGLQDLKKAQWYLNKLIEQYEEPHGI